MSSEECRIFTIGHSNHNIEKFIELLDPDRTGIKTVVDVRSVPYSRFARQFNRDELRHSLERKGIRYVYLGDKLGGRPADPSCYESDGEELFVSYERLAQKEWFKEGIQEVLREAERGKIALMCREEDPLRCHRGLLIARVLSEGAYGGSAVKVIHIRAKEKWEDHDEAMERLVKEEKMWQLPFIEPPPSTEDEMVRKWQIEKAIQERARDVAKLSNSAE